MTSHKQDLKIQQALYFSFKSEFSAFQNLALNFNTSLKVRASWDSPVQ